MSRVVLIPSWVFIASSATFTSSDCVELLITPALATCRALDTAELLFMMVMVVGILVTRLLLM